jgi:hypothetical protein
MPNNFFEDYRKEIIDKTFEELVSRASKMDAIFYGIQLDSNDPKHLLIMAYFLGKKDGTLFPVSLSLTKEN